MSVKSAPTPSPTSSTWSVTSRRYTKAPNKNALAAKMSTPKSKHWTCTFVETTRRINRSGARVIKPITDVIYKFRLATIVEKFPLTFSVIYGENNLYS